MKKQGPKADPRKGLGAVRRGVPRKPRGRETIELKRKGQVM